MRYYNVKDKNKFLLEGSVAFDEGFSRFKNEDITYIENINSKVSYLSQASAGITAKFETNSKIISIRTSVTNRFNLSNMTAISESGFDLYFFDEFNQKYQFLNTTKFDIFKNEYEVELINNNEGMKSYLLYFPLYAKVLNVEIGLDKKSLILSGNKFDKSIVFYGTSITQGASASRPGLSFANKISRELNIEIYNYGFSGQAFLEKEVATVISKVNNNKLLFIDAEPNAGIDDRFINNLEPFIKEYRKYHPITSIIVASRITYAKDIIDQELKSRREKNNNFLYSFIKNNQDKNIHYFNGNDIFTNNIQDMTIDGIHPNDLGMEEISKSYIKIIKEFL